MVLLAVSEGGAGKEELPAERTREQSRRVAPKFSVESVDHKLSASVSIREKRSKRTELQVCSRPVSPQCPSLLDVEVFADLV